MINGTIIKYTPKVTPKGQQGLLKVITNITTNKYTQHSKICAYFYFKGEKL